MSRMETIMITRKSTIPLFSSNFAHPSMSDAPPIYGNRQPKGPQPSAARLRNSGALAAKICIFQHPASCRAAPETKCFVLEN